MDNDLSDLNSKETIKAAQPPIPLRLFNATGKILSRLGVRVDLSKQSLRTSAERKARLSDFGDSSFEEPLSVLTDSIEAESRLNYFGRIMARQMITTALVNRLRIQSEILHHPSVFKTSIKRPIFIIGYPRTGTTLLHNLLALDTKNRTLKMYEALDPIPSRDSKEHKQDPRIRKAERFIKMAHFISPQVSVIHSLCATGPDECLKLIENTFISPHFLLYFHAPSYWDWLINQGAASPLKVYEYHRAQLQLIGQGKEDIRWALKAPIHLFFLDALLNIYPDACIVHLRRDPTEAIPSFCSLIALSRAMGSNFVDLKNIGAFAIKLFEISRKHAASAADTLTAPRQFYDLEYEALTRNPHAAVQQIYDFFDITPSPGLERSITMWLTRNPQHKHGVHRYSLNTFGLKPSQITN